MKNTSHYWFKRRRYGWGWVPVAWQGWLTIAAWLVVVIGGTWLLRDTPRNTFTAEVGLYLASVVLASIALLVISWHKGPSPRWRWGTTSTDEPDEDY